jgi:hypothetical protein
MKSGSLHTSAKSSISLMDGNDPTLINTILFRKSGFTHTHTQTHTHTHTHTYIYIYSVILYYSLTHWDFGIVNLYMRYIHVI